MSRIKRYTIPDNIAKLKSNYEGLLRCGILKEPDITVEKQIRLSEYEDIGLLPEEIKKIINDYNKENKIMNNDFDNKEDLIVELPCGIGSTMYCILDGFILSYTVTAIEIGRNRTWLIGNHKEYFDTKEIGNSIFFNLDDAKESLKGEANG